MLDNPKTSLWDQLNKILDILVRSFSVNEKPNNTSPKVHDPPNNIVVQEVTPNEQKKPIEQKVDQPSQVITPVTQFTKGQPNKSDHPNTIEVRKIINDEFGGGRQGWDLQCTEYTHFKVKQILKIAIDWPKDRTLPRHGRNWAKILENKYKVSSISRVGCAMSFTHPAFNNPFGHVAFVEEVLADGSVKISEANWPKDGIYSERIVKKDDLENKYQARFIDFT